MFKESDYQKQALSYFKGVPNVRLKSGKIVDIMTESQVIEVDYISKWAESIGQALVYAYEAKKEPCILYIFNPSLDSKLYFSVEPVLKHLKIKVFLINSYNLSISAIKF